MLMKPHNNDKGEWGHVYCTHFEGRKYTLLNKGASALCTALADDWYTPKPRNLPARNKLDVESVV